MKGKIIRVETADKVQLQGILYAPSERSALGVLHMPGSYGNFYENRFIDALADFYPTQGITLISCNNRGHDGNSAYERFEKCILDIEAWLNWFESNGIKRFILQGHSFGTHKIAYYLREHANEKVSGCILLAPFDLIAFYGGTEEVRRRNLRKARELADRDEDSIMPKEVWSEWPISSGTYLNLVGYETKTDLFNFRTSKEGIDALRELRVPIFAAIGGDDFASFPSPRECVDILSRTDLPCGKVTSHLINDAPHNFDGHIEDLIEKLRKWIKSSNFH